MKKIVFEQVGNIGMVGLFVAALVQSISLGSTINEITFGPIFLAFIVYSVLFGISRLWFSHFKSNGGYRPRQGEFSLEDEREKTIAYKSVMIAYKVVTTLAIIGCGLLFIMSLSLTDLNLFKILSLSALGVLIILGFIVYTVSWIILDSKG